jgi:hypothetical protein
MNRAAYLVLIASLALSGCGARLSQSEARRRIAEMSQSKLVPDAIEIRRIVSQTDTSAIVEATITLAFQFKRADPMAEWRIESVRLGDRDWISMDELMSAINDARRRATVQDMQKLAEGLEKFRSANGGFPNARDIAALTDILHPGYMDALVREDAWGRPLDYEGKDATYQLRSLGPDGLRGTPDDIVVQNAPAAP